VHDEQIARMLSVNPMARPTAQELKTHPWIRAGKITLDRLRREAEERKRVADLTRKQQSADWIRKKLAMGGFEVVKYGRNGLPHRTKLRLSADGKSVSWQPKLFKRSLLRYQNARSLASLFGGLGRDGGAGNSGSHPQLHAVPQVERLSQSNQSSSVSDADEHPSDATASARTNSNGSCSSESSSGSTSTATTSTSSVSAVVEKRLWWRSLRRERGPATERTASGGFVLPFTSRSPPVSSSPMASPTSPTSPQETVASPSSRRVPQTTQSLDDTIGVMDIRKLLLGEDASFFAGHATNAPNSCKRAVDLACVLSVVARTRELHLEFPNQDLRNGFAYLLEQIALPLREPAVTPAFCQSRGVA
jgi:hypothetical protein